MTESSSATPKSATPKTFFIVYILLMVLLAATFFLAHIDLGILGVPVALLIAAMKALLVMLFFMELRYSSGLIRAAAAMGIFWLGILMTLTMSDYISRDWLPLPGHWPQEVPRRAPGSKTAAQLRNRNCCHSGCATSNLFGTSDRLASLSERL